jgi:hypothetical protein
MANQQHIVGIEINPKFVGALFTEQVDGVIRVFCFYINGEIAHFEMSAKDNTDNLRHFFSRMNMEQTCSSVVIDDVVQGRFHVRSGENHWLYTLLSSPGNVLPLQINDICNHSWKVCWRSQEAEILEFGKAGEAVHCYAIRTTVSEQDTNRLVKESKAFCNPTFIRQKRTHSRLYLNLGLGLACLGTTLGLILFCALKSNSMASVQPAVTATASAAVSPPDTGNYYLLSNHQITGPYSVKTIAGLKAAGRLDADAMCRSETSTEWAGLSSILPTLAKQ